MTQSTHWQPTSSIETLQLRAQMLSNIRQFFAKRNVLEVDTPCLCHGTVTDVNLRAFRTSFNLASSQQQTDLFLQTSPEFAMKRLLCSGSGCIYQLGKAYRNEESGKHHNPEFTLLEWYRLGFDHLQLIDEVDQLMQAILGCPPMDKLTYQYAFLQYCGFDPLSCTFETIKTHCIEQGLAEIAEYETSTDVLLQLLFCHVIERNIGQQAPIAIIGFPASQAALARLEPNDQRVSRRFEVYYQGLELANGYHELSSVEEQRQRFEHDNQMRAAQGLPELPIDQRFLEAMQHGLPDCAGVALGFDRLLMIAANKNDIAQVLPFSFQNA